MNYFYSKKIVLVSAMVASFSFAFRASATTYFTDSGTYNSTVTSNNAIFNLTSPIPSGTSLKVGYDVISYPASPFKMMVFFNGGSSGIGFSSSNIVIGANQILVTTTGSVTTFEIRPQWRTDSASITNIFLESYVLISGPSTSDTQLSLQNTAQHLQGVYALQTSAINTGLTYDCTLFDKNNICVSVGGRYNRVNTGDVNATNGLIIGAYRPLDNVRVGAWLDQNLVVNSNNGIKLNNGAPMFGVFGVWNQDKSGNGLEVKVAAGYGDRDMTITRSAVGTSEAGSGSTKHSTHGLAAVLSYNVPVDPMWTASPYAGVRYTKSKANGYSEAAISAVTAPLTYDALTQESYTALAGLKMTGRILSNAGVFASAGIEQDFSNKTGTYSATGVTGLTPVTFNPNVNKTRPVVSLGAWYDIDKSQRLGLSGIYRTEAFQSTNTLSALATYTVGF